MSRHLTRGTSPEPPRRDRRARPGVEAMEVRQTPTGTGLTSPLALVLLNPQPLPPGSSPTTYDFQPCPSSFYRIG
jgi:hypothetical protein